MARIPEETIDQIIHATDIVDIIGSKVQLKRSGSGYTGLCPFHNEKTPSFHVHPGRQSFKCFGCGEGGSAITFLMKYEGLHFIEAAKQLADKANIQIVEEEYDPEAEKRRKRRTYLAKIHNQVADWYHQLLLKDRTEGGEKVRAYLKSRGINSEIAKKWKLGYAPGYDQQHHQWAEKNDIQKGDLVEAGIYGQQENSSNSYPRFRDRLMFPVHNEHGDVIAFSGRLLDPNAKTAKYLNSPETPLFYKSKTFFGLDKSKRAILKKDSVIICEGQLDLITSFEFGVENVVAALGTAFTENHARILKKYANETIICFDADNAGYKAAVRTFGTLAEAGLSVKAAIMPQGEDPDTLIRTHGIEKFSDLIDNAPEFYEFQILRQSETLDLENIRNRASLTTELAESISLIKDQVLQDGAIDKVSRRLSIQRNTLRDRVKEITNKPKRYQKQFTSGNAENEENSISIATSSIKNNSIAELIKLAIENSEVKNWMENSELDSILTDIDESELLQIVWRGKFDPTDIASVEQFLMNLSPNDQEKVKSCRNLHVSASSLEEAKTLVQVLERSRLDNIIQSTRTKMRDPNISAEERDELQFTIDDLEKEFLDLRGNM